MISVSTYDKSMKEEWMSIELCAHENPQSPPRLCSYEFDVQKTSRLRLADAASQRMPNSSPNVVCRDRLSNHHILLRGCQIKRQYIRTSSSQGYMYPWTRIDHDNDWNLNV